MKITNYGVGVAIGSLTLPIIMSMSYLSINFSVPGWEDSEAGVTFIASTMLFACQIVIGFITLVVLLINDDIQFEIVISNPFKAEPFDENHEHWEDYQDFLRDRDEIK